MTADDIKDGAQNTFMLSERHGAGVWNDHPAMETTFGFLWSQLPLYTYPEGELISESSPPEINSDSPLRIGSESGPPLLVPTSYHPGGVNMTYCDGHCDFVDEGITYKVYALQMSSNGADVWRPAWARDDAATNGAPPPWCRDPLSKED